MKFAALANHTSTHHFALDPVGFTRLHLLSDSQSEAERFWGHRL